MKVYLDFNHKSYGLCRIANNLYKYAPYNIELVANSNIADLVVFFAIGRHDHLLEWIKNKKYAIIQIALQSTKNPNPNDWLEIWNGAKTVWSYYDLPLKDYYHAPLAADPEIFYLENYRRDFTILTNGNVTKEESLNEVWNAVNKVNGKLAHPNNASDNELRTLYNRSLYVSGLRRKDGFELPVVEGLLCGARPIVYDAPRYRQWFYDLAKFIPEDEHVTDNLVKLFNESYEPVTKAEREETKNRFNWERIIKGFWERI